MVKLMDLFTEIHSRGTDGKKPSPGRSWRALEYFSTYVKKVGNDTLSESSLNYADCIRTALEVSILGDDFSSEMRERQPVIA